VLLDPGDKFSDVLTIAQAAAVVGRAPATVRDWIRRGYLTPMRIGRRTYVTGRAVREAEAEVWKRTPRPVQPVT
jgi:predicted site-specific integrase-resolvase